MKCYADLEWRDNNGRKAFTRVNLRVEALSSPQLLPGLSAIADALISALDVRLERVKIYVSRIPATLHTPGTSTDVYRSAVLIYREGSVRGTIEIPSPLPSLFEATGIYADVRIAAILDAPPSALLQLHNLLPSTVLPTTGAAFPTVFVVGGRSSQ